ncbi:MAG: hypothetical protein K0S33_3757 [Bacteroidetes bacterium]|jgi:hypothetical protein|nr:hypothetical protein [Bacteroidota bacterium]
MKQGITVILYCISLLIMVSCKNEGNTTGEERGLPGSEQDRVEMQERISCSPAELVEWVEDPGNHMRQEKKIGEVVYTLQYKPAAYMVCKEYGTDLNVDSANAGIASLQDMQYYNLRIKIEGFNDEFLKFNIPSTASYEERVSYFSFDMQRDLKLVEGNDTIPCALFHYERSYNLTPYGNFTIAFPATDKGTKKRTFIYKDRYLGTGAVKFLFTPSDLNHVPTLSL